MLKDIQPTDVIKFGFVVAFDGYRRKCRILSCLKKLVKSNMWNCVSCSCFSNVSLRIVVLKGHFEFTCSEPIQSRFERTGVTRFCANWYGCLLKLHQYVGAGVLHSTSMWTLDHIASVCSESSLSGCFSTRFHRKSVPPWKKQH